MCSLAIPLFISSTAYADCINDPNPIIDDPCNPIPENPPADPNVPVTTIDYVEFDARSGYAATTLANGVRVALDLASGDAVITLPDGNTIQVPSNQLPEDARSQIQAMAARAANKPDSSFELVANFNGDAPFIPYIGYPLRKSSFGFPYLQSKAYGDGDISPCARRLCAKDEPVTLPTITVSGISFRGGAFGGGGGASFRFYNAEPPEPTFRDYDYQRWKQDRDKNCAAINSNYLDLATAGAGVAIACGSILINPILGGIGCAIANLYLVRSAEATSQSVKRCNLPYGSDWESR